MSFIEDSENFFERICAERVAQSADQRALAVTPPGLRAGRPRYRTAPVAAGSLRLAV